MTTREHLHAVIDSLPEGDLVATRERIHEEIDRLSEEDLARRCREAIDTLVSRTPEAPRVANGPGLLDRLMQIKIQAPADFSVNLDRYAAGEEPLGDGGDVH